jgi:Protein of unknown function (DUF1566)
MKKYYALLITIGFIGLVFLLLNGCSAKEVELNEVIKFRSEYRTISEAEAKEAVKKYHFYHNKWNKFRSFANKFELREISGDKVVIDHATNLVWHQSGSGSKKNWEQTKEWFIQFNKRGYAGYRTWRLPTLEEAASLLESKRKKKCYIDTLFSNQQYSIRTGDIYNEVRHWGVSFYVGRIFKVGINESDFIRPVTELK